MKTPLLTPKTFPLPPATVTPQSAGNDSSNEEKHPFNWGWIAWPLVVLLLYVLSFGPVVKVDNNGKPHAAIFESFTRIYVPLGAACNFAPLGRPVRMYLHLWDPEHYDKTGRPIYSVKLR